MKFLIICLLMLATSISKDQYSVRFIIKDAGNKEPLPKASIILNGRKGATSDSAGLLSLNNIPAGIQIIEFGHIGYNSLVDTFNFPLASSELIEILLERKEEELAEVMVTSTRISRRIKNLPTRIELVEEEEIDEK